MAEAGGLLKCDDGEERRLRWADAARMTLALDCRGIFVFSPSVAVKLSSVRAGPEHKLLV